MHTDERATGLQFDHFSGVFLREKKRAKIA